MDKEEFNAMLCLLKYVDNCSLYQMITRQNQLDLQIRILHSDMQSLLYDNYRKFIEASSMVSSIKSEINKMEDEATLLQSKMKDLEGISTAVLENLQPTQSKITKLLKWQEVMKKLVLLTDLIPTLKAHVESRKYETAAFHYLKAKSVLQKYHHFPSFRGIVKECDEIMDHVKQKLKEKLRCDIFNEEEMEETAKLILALNVDANLTLQCFLSHSEDCLANTLSAIHKKCGLEISEKVEGKTKEDLITLELTGCIALSCYYVQLLSKIIIVVRNVFLKCDKKNISFSAYNMLEDFIEKFAQRLYSVLYLNFQSAFVYTNDEFMSIILDKLCRRSHDCNLILPQLDFYTKSIQMMLKICADRCEFHLRNLTNAFLSESERLMKELSEKSHSLNISYMRFETSMKDNILTVLFSLKNFVRPEFIFSRNIHFRKIFCKSFAREGIFVSYFRYIKAKSLEILQNADKKTLYLPALSLLFSKYMLQMYHSSITQFMNMIDEQLYAPIDDIPLSQASDIACEFKAVAREMLDMYVRIRQEKTSAMVRKSLENKKWMRVKEPRRVSVVVKRVLEDLNKTKSETESLFGSTKGSSRDRASDSGRTFNSKLKINSPIQDPTDEAVFNRISTIFIQQPTFFKTVDFTSYSITSCIVNLTLKCYSEYIRQITFNSFGLQQIQVDMYYFQTFLSQHFGIEEDFIPFFDNIISSCYNRTFQPQLMKHQVVAALCQEF
ncbi:vacuolar protein sorting-associated protein 51 homolog [Stegodyphus dumicola]|uniref:vacuolar protein sorting-associated protein 51 homolog n=1 Tax=Stegodyphus dumicola TaxID=202533 RepID=UPI0015A9B164|nr:vacuolar protein sorting-associated protein 51 homolog [Stegodyphus dumicola]